MKGGGDVDTTGSKIASAQMMGLANEAAGMARQNYGQGSNMVKTYGQPIWDAILNMVTGVTKPGSGTNPLANTLMGQPLEAGSQAFEANKKRILNAGLGPGQTNTAIAQAGLEQQGGIQKSILQIVQDGIKQLLGVGQEGESMMMGAPGQMIGAGSLFGQAGQLENQVSQMELQAQQSGNLGLAAGLKGLGSLFGTVAGFALGGPAGGMLGGMLGGASGGVTGGGSNFDMGTSAPSYSSSLNDIKLMY